MAVYCFQDKVQTQLNTQAIYDLAPAFLFFLAILFILVSLTSTDVRLFPIKILKLLEWLITLFPWEITTYSSEVSSGPICGKLFIIFCFIKHPFSLLL